MTLPTYQEVVSKYLWGSTTPPADASKASESWIRPSNASTSIDVSISDFMSSTGPGRFALGAKFTLVDSFFNTSNANFLGIGTVDAFGNRHLTKADLGAYFGISDFSYTMQHINYRDSYDDYVARSFLYNSMSFSIADDADFVITARGYKEIHNFSIVLRSSLPGQLPETFDFTGGGIQSQVANWVLGRDIDPMDIGRFVKFNFTGTIPSHTYTLENYQSDFNIMATWQGVDYSVLEAGRHTIYDNLYASGITRYLNENQQPILYGTNESDSIVAEQEIAAFGSDAESRIIPYLSNGVVVLSGDGDDLVV